QGTIIGGNSTDRALMSFLIHTNATAEIDKKDIREFYAFDSIKKYSSVTVTDGGDGYRTYIKGAPEKIIDRCTHYIDKNGEIRKLEDPEKLQDYLNAQAGRSMRLLGVAMTDGDGDRDDLTLICVISIRDNVRKEAVDAIKEVRNAGIQVVMVTGDRRETAVAIARESGLLTSTDDVTVTSSEMEAMSDDELKKILPRLRVVSRALPTDKSRLVRVAQELNYVVGMTGDGVNDSPALKKADVGFAMGSGTEVAKEAGDITILDDNFSSIEKAILYGRTMFRSIRKFLIFQLTINVAAVLTCFIGPLFGVNVVLTVVQLLLVNLAMDTLAAIAFGSEPALQEYMRDKPVPRNEGIITGKMFIQVIIGALYITLICLAILFLPAIKNLFGDVDETYLKSAVFATFMMAITLNGFNARTRHLNVFESLGRNTNFLLVTVSLLVLQYLFVTFGGKVLCVESLNIGTWLFCLMLAVLVIPIDIVRKIIIQRTEN
ncbi:MAG: cation-translocating P-type ATPase, partial [Thermoguttaceae bacterium]|nr:cation-translocating P-type ATPase [Thermoguttaceae bacterium]